MPSRACVITGASSGIGLALAEALGTAKLDLDLILVGRDEARLAQATARVKLRAGNDRSVTAIRADLSTLAGTRELAKTLLASAPHLGVLVHNAGLWPEKRNITTDGFEEAFATNHLSPFLLNQLLKDRLIESAPSRIVQVSAGLYVRGRIDLEQGPKGFPSSKFSGFRAYCDSKLWNLVATMEWARQLEGKGVTANAVHPGVVQTRLGDRSGLLGVALSLIKRLWLTPEDGARGPFHLAVSDELATTTGRYFNQLRLAELAANARGEELGRTVFSRTQALVGTP